MQIKVRCEAGCARADELGYGLCKRCLKAKIEEVESPQEKSERIRLENLELIQMAENGRETIMSRFDSLDAHHSLLVTSYVGGEAQSRGIFPLTPIGRAATILLFAEAMIIMVPEEHRPWMKDGKVTDM